MANEKRLIDVWDLIEWLDNFDRENTLRILRGKKAKLLNSHAIRNMIVTVPRVDAVEVVHCDNCAAHGSCVFEPILHCLGYKKPFCCAGKMDGDEDE